VYKKNNTRTPCIAGFLRDCQHTIYHNWIVWSGAMQNNGATEKTNKIILPQNLQREILKFFLKTSIPKITADKERQQQPQNSNEWSGKHD